MQDHYYAQGGMGSPNGMGSDHGSNISYARGAPKAYSVGNNSGARFNPMMQTPGLAGFQDNSSMYSGRFSNNMSPPTTYSQFDTKSAKRAQAAKIQNMQQQQYDGLHKYQVEEHMRP